MKKINNTTGESIIWFSLGFICAYVVFLIGIMFNLVKFNF